VVKEFSPYYIYYVHKQQILNLFLYLLLYPRLKDVEGDFAMIVLVVVVVVAVVGMVVIGIVLVVLVVVVGLLLRLLLL
jgi:hypothetical protein